MGDYGTRIKAAREAAQLTQEQLGEKVGVTGVTIMRYEKNQREPRLKKLFEIAAATEVSPAYLMGCKNNDGTIDLGLVAIELSRVFGIDRVIVPSTVKRSVKVVIAVRTLDVCLHHLMSMHLCMSIRRRKELSF